ncbi:hypothetical protein H0H92_008398, partial [Tricholoma furcatifolium]
NLSAAAQAQSAGKSSICALSKPVSKEAFWNACVARITIKLNKLFKYQEGHIFIQKLYDQFLLDCSPSPLDDALAVASKLQKSIYQYSEEILNLSGMEKDWVAADAMCTQVCNMVRGLQEVIVDAIVDVDDLKQCHTRKELIFQSLV